MPTTDHRKQSLYFPEDMLEEIQVEAGRQDRSLSWVVQQAWKVARAEIRRMPSVNDVIGTQPTATPIAAATTPSVMAVPMATPNKI